MPEVLDNASLQPATLAAPAAPSSAARPFGLHMEAAYILDCSVELGEITPMEDLVFRVENPASLEFIQRTDRDELLPPHWLRNTARQYLDSLPLEDRYVWALRGLEGMGMGLRFFQERLEFVVQTKVQSDLGVEVRTAISWLDEGTEDMFRDKRFGSVHDVTQANVDAFVDAKYGAAKARLAEDVNLTQDALAWLALPGNRAIATQIAMRLFKEVPAVTDAAGVTPRALALASAGRQRKTQRRARSAIKKALRLFYRTGMEDSVRLMVQGQEVVLSHPDSPFKFVLQPLQAGWLEQKTVAPGGHVPYQLTLMTKDDVFLSRLCVLFDATPVLDQLLSLTFFVQTGHENDLLAKANWFGYEDAQAVRGILQDKAPALLNKVPAPGNRAGDRLSTVTHTRSAEHWTPYKGPVKSWIGAWLGDVSVALTALGSNATALA